jgi:4-hydroxyphenylpyruvate dioxygenase
MKIDHIHFFVEDTTAWAHWFIETMGCQSLNGVANNHTRREVLRNGSIYFVLSSPITQLSPVFDYLRHHPPGVVDIAFNVEDITSILAKATHISESLQSFQCVSGHLKWAKIAGCGALTHTLIENTSSFSFCEVMGHQMVAKNAAKQFAIDAAAKPKPSAVDLTSVFTQIDHVVLNVAAGELQKTVDWYCTLFNFEVKQTFNIQTQYSGLSSRVLTSADHEMYFNINEPTSSNSQIQKFLEVNRGSGIQHIALRTSNIVKAVTELRKKGQDFLSVPSAYYLQLKQKFMPILKHLLKPTELTEIQAHHILVDGLEEGSASVLLQIFTQPIFKEPTFFLS